MLILINSKAILKNVVEDFSVTFNNKSVMLSAKDDNAAKIIETTLLINDVKYKKIGSSKLFEVNCFSISVYDN